tara:strand:- start:1155 stop:2336 length:1182 start_codon:yes stop_codon:yes gene_type:complete
MKKITDKIIEVNYWYNLHNRDLHKTSRQLKINHATVSKYINISNNLDFELFCKLDEKGCEKLTLGCAHRMIETFKNPDQQYLLYQEIKGYRNNERILKISEYDKGCPLCCEEKHVQIKFQCCNTFMCLTCIYKHLEISINDIVFQGCKCPFCNTFLDFKEIKNLLIFRRKNLTNYLHYNHFNRTNKKKYRNLFLKMINIIEKINHINHERNFDSIQKINEKNVYYGICQFCSPPVDSLIRNYRNIKIKTIQKQCVNNRGNIVSLDKEMFKCGTCIDKGNQPVIFKKCPHCGIKTLKPEGCNYVQCGDHRWCFICNERLPVSHEGHNVHYWMGAGTSAFSDQCRRSKNYYENHHVLENCSCIFCRYRGGKALCINIDCNNVVETTSIYCEKCTS